MKDNYWIRGRLESESFRQQQEQQVKDKQQVEKQRIKNRAWNNTTNHQQQQSPHLTEKPLNYNNNNNNINDTTISDNNNDDRLRLGDVTEAANAAAAAAEQVRAAKRRLMETANCEANNKPHTDSAPAQEKVKQEESRVNLSFCGCGFLGIYHVGVASCFHEYAPQLSMHKISGSSAGALVAVAHICGNLQLAYATTDILRVAIDARARALGPFHPSFDITATIREALERGLPDDVHLQASGKLHVSLTRVYDGANVIISEFESKADVIQVLVCSCFIPFWSGLVAPKYKGVAYIDGGFSNNLLILDDKTVTVSPFAGETDICPQDDTFNLLQVSLSNTSFSLSPSNLYRLSHALLPPPPEVLSDLCEQGFADGIKFLQRMKLISCNKCLQVRSSLLVTTNGEDMEEAFNSQVHSTSELMESANSSHFADNTHSIRLEQQEEKTIEISGNRRRDSVVSTTSQMHQQQAQQRQVEQHQQQPRAGNSTAEWLQTTVSDDDDNCDECVLMRQRALSGPLPEQFSDRIRDACDTVNKSLSNWIYSHRPIKYLSYLAAPYYLPVEFSLALISRCWQRMPFLRNELIDCICNLVEFLIGTLRRMHDRSTSTILMSSSFEAEEASEYEKEMIRHHQKTVTTCLNRSSSSTLSCSTEISSSTNQTTTSTTTTVESSISLKITSDRVCVSKLKTPRTSTCQLHSLEDTFDSIVDVTSNQEARIFAYYFRDAKNRLQVTEIFDYERASELSKSTPSLSDLSLNSDQSQEQQQQQQQQQQQDNNQMQQHQQPHIQLPNTLT